MAEFWKFLNRLLDSLDDIWNTRAILGLFTVAGFYYILNKVIDKLVDPPAAELYTIVNLALALPLMAVGFYFGQKEGQKKNGG